MRSWLQVAVHPVPLGTPVPEHDMVCSGSQDIPSIFRRRLLGERQPSFCRPLLLRGIR